MTRIRSFSLLAALALVAAALAVPMATSAAAAPVSRFACDAKDASDKGWVLPVYVHQPGKDTYDADLPALVNTLWETDQTFDASSQRFGVSRRLRVAQDDQCRLAVAKVAVPKGSDRGTITGALAKQLAAQPEVVKQVVATGRYKALFFVQDDDIIGSCTGGGANAGLAGGNAVLPRWCWSEAGLTHETLHTFGLSHCNQSGPGPNGNDPVCRGYGTKPECTSDPASTYHLDHCRIDEFRYFEPTPVKQPPLEKDRNVVNSPYLVQDQQSPTWELRLKNGDKCLDSGQDVVLQPCSSQVWRRDIDADGYFTLRDATTGRCLKMSGGKAISAACADRDPSQQWLPQAEQEKVNFANRTGGRLQGGPYIAELLDTQTTTPVPTPTPTPTPSVSTGRNVQVKSPYGSCLADRGSAVTLGSCLTRWRIVPVLGKAVQIRHKGRCLTLGPVKLDKRSAILAKCSWKAKGQRWLVESRPDGTATLKSAHTRATRLVGRGLVYAKAAYPAQSLKFMIG